MQLVHQGSTHFDATFWVGANALVRTVALGDLAVTAMEGPKVVRRYIHERTVIEDTESTVDLVDAGWRVHNYPARLAYSATPPDYGSLLIQRRRWANGGLIILPKLLRSLRRRGMRGRGAEAFIRVHYLVSIATSNVALLLLLALPSTHGAPVELVALTCLPYFVIYARDLRLLGRRRRDLFEVYCLNLLLLPVNLGGVVMSVRQGLSGRRIPFGRTPKISDRTSAPALYLAGTFGLLALWAVGALLDGSSGRPVHGVLGAVNAALLAFAISRYVGWRHAVADLLAPVCALRRRSRPAVPEAPAGPEGDPVQPEPTVAITLPARTGAAA
jgi:cellulose synthase (UDP-forming)